MALVRVPFYFINLLPTSLLYISILLVRGREGGRERGREGGRERARALLCLDTFVRSVIPMSRPLKTRTRNVRMIYLY